MMQSKLSHIGPDWSAVDMLLSAKRAHQQELNFRNPADHYSADDQIHVYGVKHLYHLKNKFHGLSDQELKIDIQKIDMQIEYYLDRLFLEY